MCFRNAKPLLTYQQAKYWHVVLTSGRYHGSLWKEMPKYRLPSKRKQSRGNAQAYLMKALCVFDTSNEITLFCRSDNSGCCS